jgi:hypothetical protein
MAPQIEVDRYEVWRLWRPQNWLLSAYPSVFLVRVKKLLYITGKMSQSSIMHEMHCLLCCHWDILL